MSKNALLQVRINSDVKKQAEKALNSLGMTLSQAVTVFLTQVSLKQRIPFSVSIDDSEDKLTKSELLKVIEGLEDLKYGRIKNISIKKVGDLDKFIRVQESDE